ncbi:uncharacterized protein [Engystomops pustulosus]|uniref:uncharacterized protein isoform X1 n=1 Tax=Engystomops pustulosus TaxID=76066 RepID=UPI003AFB7E84
MPSAPRHVVRIFSRDGDTNYKWLINLLRMGGMFQTLVMDVRPVYISNKSSSSFIDGLSESSFAILYHTKKRGRLNIANVTDSLYDQELEDLSRHLGKSNVVVLVDDVEDSSDTNKMRIREEQDLGTYAQEVILISEMEKGAYNLTGGDPRFSPSLIPSHQQDAYNSLMNKLHVLKDIMKDSLSYTAGLYDAFTEASLLSSKIEGTSKTSSSFKSNADTGSYRSYNLPGAGLNIDERTPLHSDTVNNPPERPPIPIDNINDEAKRKKRRDKMVFGIIGGVIALLVIVLIIVLCVTL